MLRFLYGDDLARFPRLRDTMFRDRARQFCQRLGLEQGRGVPGMQRDDYDLLNPLYVIWQDGQGAHGGSLRLLPTLGRTMVGEYFTGMTGGRRFSHPKVWEMTRFCLARGGGARVSAALMLGLAEVGVGLGLARAIGLLDADMVALCQRLGWEPVVLGSEGRGIDQISLGMWEFSDELRRRLALRAGITPEQSRQGFARALGAARPLSAAG